MSSRSELFFGSLSSNSHSIVQESPTASSVLYLNSDKFVPIAQRTFVLHTEEGPITATQQASQPRMIIVPAENGPLLTDMVLLCTFSVRYSTLQNARSLADLSVFDFIDTVTLTLNNQIYGSLTWDYIISYFDTHLQSGQKQELLNMCLLGSNFNTPTTSTSTGGASIEVDCMLPLPFAFFNSLTNALPTSALRSTRIALTYTCRQTQFIIDENNSIALDSVDLACTYAFLTPTELDLQMQEQKFYIHRPALVAEIAIDPTASANITYDIQVPLSGQTGIVELLWHTVRTSPSAQTIALNGSSAVIGRGLTGRLLINSEEQSRVAGTEADYAIGLYNSSYDRRMRGSCRYGDAASLLSSDGSAVSNVVIAGVNRVPRVQPYAYALLTNEDIPENDGIVTSSANMMSFSTNPSNLSYFSGSLSAQLFNDVRLILDYTTIPIATADRINGDVIRVYAEKQSIMYVTRGQVVISEMTD